MAFVRLLTYWTLCLTPVIITLLEHAYLHDTRKFNKFKAFKKVKSRGPDTVHVAQRFLKKSKIQPAYSER